MDLDRLIDERARAEGDRHPAAPVPVIAVGLGIPQEAVPTLPSVAEVTPQRLIEKCRVT